MRPLREPDRVVSLTPTNSMARPRVSTRLFAGDDDAARQGCADQFVAADGDAVDTGVEPERLWVIDVGQDHAAERGVGVNVVFPDAQLVNDLSNRGDVVHSAAHGGADCGQDDGRPVTGGRSACP